MSEKFDEIKYKNDYNRANYYTARVVFPKSDENLIKSAAANAGKSISDFIKTAVMEKIEKS